MWIDEEIGQVARTIRERRGVTIETVAKTLGVTSSDVVAIEEGRMRLSAEKLFDYCKLMQVPVSLFFEWHGDRHRESDDADHFPC